MIQWTTTPSQLAISRRLRAVLVVLLAATLLLLISLLISHAEPAAVVLSATKTDSLLIDANGDGLPNAGDTLLYQIAITNDGDDPATRGLFADGPDVNTTLVVGSVQTSQGTVLRGNTPGDIDVYADTGNILAFSTMTISFQAQINDPLPAGVTEISNQGQLRTAEVLIVYTDDPDAAAADDPTVTTLVPPTIIVEKTLIAVDLDDIQPNFLTFTISVSNIGSTVADFLPLFDEYDTNYLSFVNATIYPNEAADDGLLTWYDLTFRVTRDITITVNTARVTGALDLFGVPLGAEDSDAVVINVPTAAEMLYFRTGKIDGQKVQLEWATATEVDNVGFKLYRAFDPVSGQAEQVAYIPSQAHGSGAPYAYVDIVPQSGAWAR
jgi:uncharacterized repeat protein (TIGR01451 family)